MKIQKKDQKKFCDRQTNQLNQPTKNHGKTTSLVYLSQYTLHLQLLTTQHVHCNKFCDKFTHKIHKKILFRQISTLMPRQN